MNVFFYTVKNKKTERFALFLTKISVFLLKLQSSIDITAAGKQVSLIENR